MRGRRESKARKWEDVAVLMGANEEVEEES